MIDPMHNPDHFQNPKRQSFTEALLKRDGLQGPVLDIGENVLDASSGQGVGR